MMNNCKEQCCWFCAKWMNRSLGLLILRVVLGALFVAHGWQKWQMMDQVVGFFGQMGLPAFTAYLVTAVELLAGLAMILGIGTCVAGLLLSIVMIVSIYIVKIKWGGTLIPTQAAGPSYELNLIFLAAALAISFAGPGKYSLGAYLKGKCGDMNCGNCNNK